MRKLFLLLVVLSSAILNAQIPILEKSKSVKNNKVIIKSVDTQVKIVGNLSTTTTTIVLQNQGNRILEGKVVFPLPEGVTVSGYALDINGKLRNAVPVTKEKAKEVFESIERRRVDPGIIEKVEGNNFRTRVYPINPKKTRTVQITYNQLLENQETKFVYHLLTSSEQKIPEFKLKISVFDQVKTPELEETPDGNFNFEKNGNAWTAEINKNNFKPNKNLTVSIPKANKEVKSIFQPASHNSFYFLSNITIPQNIRKKAKPIKIALVWDNSLSGMDRNHEKELALLEQYLKWIGNVKVQVYTLNNTLTKAKRFRIKRGDFSDLKYYLTEIKYDGGTDFETLKNISADEILLFSDGISSFGDFKPNVNQRIYSIISSVKANYQNLVKLSAKNGAVLNLNQNTPEVLLKNMTFDNLRFLGIEQNKSVSDVVSANTTITNGNLSIAGILYQPETVLKLKFGYGNKVDFTQKVVLNSYKNRTQNWDISKFWAQYKIADLELQSDNHQSEIEEIGKQFSIVTNNTSLMVLERVEDYVRYKISPPAELQDEYDRITKANLERLTEKRKGIMKDAEEMMVTLKKWWNTDFKPKKRYPKVKKNQNNSTSISGVVSDGTSPFPGVNVRVEGTQTVVQTDFDGKFSINAELGDTLVFSSVGMETVKKRIDNTRFNIVMRESNETLEEVVVTGYGNQHLEESEAVEVEEIVENVPFRSNRNKRKAKKSGKITVVDVKSDKEYMKFFEGKNTDEIYNTYLKHRKDYQTTPSYYFDVAQILWKKDKKLSLKILSSIADLGLENAELYKLLAYRLKKIGAYKKELWITKKVLDWRPFDPQSYRDYALALEDNGEYQKALDNLYKILTKSYSEEISARDNGIEETVLMELNQLISRRKSQLNISEINPKLITDLPVNIRVVLNWNKDHTDIDLWVTDPKGEKCMYNHKKTEIGGRLSRDFTGGFGPEQFLLKKAVKGKYKIETNFYGERQVSVSGATTLMAEIYIDYASGNQERKIVVFQSDKKKGSRQNKKGVLIGEFEF